MHSIASPSLSRVMSRSRSREQMSSHGEETWPIVALPDLDEGADSHVPFTETLGPISSVLGFVVVGCLALGVWR